ncbi:thermonuclease family protein [Chitinimonas koreensis]|uniref:thermonuclease family protein n=1 Tax=Chitinimonas koreensis TaxID=356302 RepID=UPI0004098100|nr:thermonuclease family protein [Chitinimonas koreensis]QNM94964.1 thermonuclease family protein [Chitinimonas koreensis]
MSLFRLLQRACGGRSWSVRLGAVAALAVAAFMAWQGELGGAFGAPVAGTELHGRVIGVADGDTLEVLTEAGQRERVRLAYIDAPEHDQPWGTRARQALAKQVFGRAVVVREHGRDRYGRLLGDVLVEGRDVSEAQLAAGMAWHYLHYARKDQPADSFERYQDAERTARNRQEGLWHDDAPTAPWDFRHAGRR